MFYLTNPIQSSYWYNMPWSLSHCVKFTLSFFAGLKLAHSNGGNKQSELTCLQRRAAELTGMPLINFNIKRSAPVRGPEGPVENDVTLKNEKQVSVMFIVSVN